MKYIKGIFFVCFLSSLYPMEHVELLKKEQINFILERSKENIYCCNLSDGYRNSLQKKYIADQLPILHRVAFLPPEIQNQIFTPMLQVMFGNDEKAKLAVELFCTKPIIKAFQLYCNIKKNIKKHELITSIYVMDENKQNILLSRLNPWYGDYINPIMYDDEEIEEDEKEYFAGKKVCRVPARIRERGPLLCGVISFPSIITSVGGTILLGCGEKSGWMIMGAGNGLSCLLFSFLSCVIYLQSEKIEL